MQRVKAAVEVVRLGRVSYASALQVQQFYVRRHLEAPDRPSNALILCEHPPVYTTGLRQAPYPAEEERRLRALGAEFYRTTRGGLITFHGPGQLLCYPVLHLGCFKRSVRWYVCELERTVISLCRTFGINASTSPDTGVWVGENKICAIGILNLSSFLGTFIFTQLHHLRVCVIGFWYVFSLFRDPLWEVHHISWLGSELQHRHGLV